MSFRLLNIKAMKTKKNRPLAAETASADVGIASDALARLAEKLKTDLSKPEQQSKQKTSRPLDISGSKRSKSKQTERLLSNDTAEVGGKDKNSPSKKSNSAANSSKSDEAKQHKKPSLQDGKTNPKQHSQTSRSPKTASSLKPAASKRNRTGEKSFEEKPENDSLLEEIIALGGTKEDLELIDGISSDEGESSSVQKPKGKVDNDKSVCLRISLLIISCRRNYRHNSNPWD